jgi:hypothetical protein
VPRADLAGVSDLHVHSAPCRFDRIADDLEMAELAERGATLELCSGTVQTLLGYTTVETVARTIRRVGSERCIVSSDTGSPRKPCPPGTTRAYLYSLGVLGISDAELRSMSVESPQRLLEFRR